MPSAPAVPSVYLDRAEGGQPLAAGPGAPQLPTVNLWPFAMQETTPGDRMATSPLLRGPGVIDQAYLVYTDDSNSPNPTIAIFYGLSLPPSGNTPVGNLADLGTPIFQNSVISSEIVGAFQSPFQHIPIYTFAGGSGRIVLPLRYYVPLEQFQVCIRFGTQGAGSHALAGYLRILENVPPELLPNFL